MNKKQAQAASARATQEANKAIARSTKHPKNAELAKLADEACKAACKANKIARKMASAGPSQKKKRKKKIAAEAYPCEAAVKAMGANMTSPYFSFIAADEGSSVEALCGGFSCDAHVPFEIILAGSNPPEQMPANSRYIQTNAKPAQCLELAARNAVGEYLIIGTDDVNFSPYFMNKLYVYTLRLLLFDVVVGSRLQGKNDVGFLDDKMVFDENVQNSPVIVMTPTIKRDIWNSLGGVDARLHSSLSAGLDMQVRCYERGMTPLLIPDCSVSKTDLVESLQLEASNRALLNSLWITKDGKMSRTRLSPVEPFTEEELRA